MEHQTLVRLRAFAAAAMCGNDEDYWGSDEQIAAQNSFCSILKTVIGLPAYQRFEDWCLKATTDEIMTEGMRLALAAFGSAAVDGVRHQRADGNKHLTGTTGAILDNVIAALFDAEEIWGCGEDDYVPLMQAVKREADSRIAGFNENFAISEADAAAFDAASATAS